MIKGIIFDMDGVISDTQKLHSKVEAELLSRYGVSGMQAAKTGGMKCVGLVQDLDKTYPTKNLVTSLSEITKDYINQI